MKKYSVAIPYHCTVFVKVEAKDISDALEKAYEKASPFLCHQCSDGLELGEINDEVPADIVEV